MAKFVRWLQRWRVAIFALAAATTVLGLTGLQRVTFDPDVLVYFDRKMPERQALEAIEDRFGRTNEVVFVLRVAQGSFLEQPGLEALRFLHNAAAKLPGAISVRSVLSLIEDRHSPSSLGERGDPKPAAAQLRAAVQRASQSERAVLSADATVAAVAVIVPRNSRNDIDVVQVAAAARQLQDEVRKRYPAIEVLLTGRLMMDSAFLTEGQDETFFYAAIQLAVLALVVVITFRSIILGAILMAMVLIATLATIGIVGWTGFPLNGISSAAPSVLLGLAVATAVHIMMGWQAAHRQGMSRQAAVTATMAANAVPVTLSVLTTLVSFLCLNFAASPPFRQLGNVVTLGLVMIYIASFTLLPALLLWVPSQMAGRGLQLEEMMAGLARFVARRRRTLMAAFALVTAASFAGIAQIRFDDTFSHYFDERFEIRRATDLFEAKLSGTIFVDFSAPVASGEEPFGRAHLRRLQDFSAWLMARSEVAGVVSLASFAEDAAQKAPPSLFDKSGLPETAEAKLALAGAYQAARAEGMIGLVDEAGRFSRVNVVLRGVSSADTLAFVRAAETKAAEIFGGSVMATGLPRLSAQLSLDSSRAMIISMVFTLAAVSLLLLIALRDVKLGLISLLPNLVPIIAAFGVWGMWVGEVSFAATVVGALTFGIIVDDTVHILVKYRALRQSTGLTPEAAVETTFRSVGVAVVATSVALTLSFAVFTFSGFLVNQHLGALTAMVIVAALIADLLFLPALLLILETRRIKTPPLAT